MLVSTIKRTSVAVAMLFSSITTFGQLGVDTNWHWVGGDYLTNVRTIYFPITVFPWVPTPGARMRPATWTDGNNNLWMMGGLGYDGIGHKGNMNDLWKFSMEYRTWFWMKGSTLIESQGLYGTMGTSDPMNNPRSRFGSVTWTDNSGNLWLFGGEYDSSASFYLNDLWKFNSTTNQWTWIKGDSTFNGEPVYGTIGIPDPSNIPGARSKAVSWTDNEGNLWLFGGYGFGSMGGLALLNDLWKYDIASNQWTWMKGYQYVFGSGVYGIQGVPSPSNTPGSRMGSVSWKDQSGNLWLWGGNGISETQGGILNDLWRYEPATGNWTWMKGAKLQDQRGVYGQLLVPSDANIPPSREGSYAWTDNIGNFWLYGGEGYTLPITKYADLWKYNTFTNQWTWMKGDSVYQNVLHNVGGVPFFIERPGSRARGASWSTSNGFLWLLGGETSSTTMRNDFFAIASQKLIVLPVTIVHFSGTQQGNSVKLNWETADEVNFSYFNLQRSVDGTNYENIGTIYGASGRDHEYSYVDHSDIFRQTRKIYYRLKVVDNDGSYSFSKVVVIKTGFESGDMTVYPVPTQANLQVTFYELNSGAGLIQVMNMNGQVVISKQIQPRSGINVVGLNTAVLTSGSYVIYVRSASGVRCKTFIRE